MTTYNTGNPIGSTDARDRLDNSENMDILENSTTLNEHADRLGTMRKTRKGMEDEHDAQIAAHETEFADRILKMAFTPSGTFTAGATLFDARQTLLWEVSQGGDGHYYSWSGSFGTSGKVVTAGSTPSPIAAGSWVDRTDDALRDEIRETVFQNMKRQAAEAGFNLVDGSFEEGGVLNDSLDVLWFQGDGKYYQWHLGESKTVVAGSTPTNIGTDWIDTTDMSLRSEILAGFSVGRNAVLSLRDFVSVKDFGAKGDGVTDDTSVIQEAIDYCYTNKRRLYIPAGTYLISSSLYIYGSDQYYENGSLIFGEGRGKSIIKITGAGGSPQDFAVTFKKDTGDYSTIWNCVLRDFTVDIETPGAWSGVGYYGTVSRIDMDGVDVTGSAYRAVWFDTAYFCSFKNMLMFCTNSGLRIYTTGTSNRFDNLGVFGATAYAYQFTGNYSSVGDVFAEDCTGVIFRFYYFGGSVQSLGCENSTSFPTNIIENSFSNTTIGYLHTIGLNMSDAAYRTISNSGDAFLNIDSIRIAASAFVGQKHAGSLLNQYNGDVTINNVNSDVLFTTSSDTRANDASLTLNPPNSTGISFDRGNRRPFIGANSTYWDALAGTLGDYGTKVKAIYLDAYGGIISGGSSGGTNYQYQIPPSKGDWFLENSPDVNMVAGYVCTAVGADVGGSSAKAIPLLLAGTTAQRPTVPSSKVGVSYYDTTLNKPIWWNGASWRDATGTVV